MRRVAKRSLAEMPHALLRAIVECRCDRSHGVSATRQSWMASLREGSIPRTDGQLNGRSNIGTWLLFADECEVRPGPIKAAGVNGPMYMFPRARASAPTLGPLSAAPSKLTTGLGALDSDRCCAAGSTCSGGYGPASARGRAQHPTAGRERRKLLIVSGCRTIFDHRHDGSGSRPSFVGGTLSPKRLADPRFPS